MSSVNFPSTLEILRQVQAASRRRRMAELVARGATTPSVETGMPTGLSASTLEALLREVKPTVASKGPLGRPMRIAVVGGRGVPSSYSGVEAVVEALFAEFASMGHKVTIYCRPGVLDTAEADYRGMRLVRTPALPGKLETLTHTAASCVHAVRHGATNDGGEPFDVISFHALPSNLAQKIPLLAGIPTVAHVHGLDHLREKWRGLGAALIRQGEREMVKHAAHVVTVNGSLVQYYREQYGLNATFLPNGSTQVSDDFRPCDATMQKFGIRAGGYFVMVSRLVPEKRHQDAIAAFRRVNTSMKLLIVGEGNQSGDYVKMIKEVAGDDPRIVFTGLQSGETLQTLFRCAYAYLTASELEGMPASLLECMERKVCAICSDIGPHVELTSTIEGYDLGFPVGDVDALQRSIERAIASPDLVRTLGERMREFVRSHYNWPALAEATEQLYQKVLSDRRQVALPRRAAISPGTIAA